MIIIIISRSTAAEWLVYVRHIRSSWLPCSPLPSPLAHFKRVSILFISRMPDWYRGSVPFGNSPTWRETKRLSSTLRGSISGRWKYDRLGNFGIFLSKPRKKSVPHSWHRLCVVCATLCLAFKKYLKIPTFRSLVSHRGLVPSVTGWCEILAH